MVLLDNRQVREGWEPLKESVTGLFAKHGAEVVSARRWDERRLAYPIKGQTRGTYLLVYFNGEATNNSLITRELELNEATLRHMTTQCEEIPAEAYEPEAEFDINAIPTDDEPAEEQAPEGKEKAEKAPEGDTEKTEGEGGETADAEKAEGGETADAEKAEGDAEKAEGEPEPAAATASAEGETEKKTDEAAPDAGGDQS